MLLSRHKYRKIRSRVSILPYYWRLYEKKFPKNSMLLFYQFNIDLLLNQDFYMELTRKVKLPFTKKVLISQQQYNRLTHYTKVTRKLRSSLKRNRPILPTK